MIDEINEDAEEMYEGFDAYLGKGWKMTHKITDVEDLSQDDYDNLVNEYKNEYDIKIKDAKQVTIKLTIESDSLNESDSMTLRVIKVKGSWYLDINSLNSMF